MELLFVPLNPAIRKKKVKTLRNLLNLLHILSCALPICFSRNLLNLSNRCLRRRRRLLQCVSPLPFSSVSFCPFFLPSPASLTSRDFLFLVTLLVLAVSFFPFPPVLPLACDHSLELSDTTTELVCALVLARR